MKKLNQRAPDEVMGDATIGARSGLNPLMAKRIRDTVHAFGSTVTIRNGRGVSANARNLFELLLLGAREGERVTVCCVGPDAHAAHDALVGALQARGGGP
jgi:phosphotransferase system HPr (HPr) family protein